MVAALRLGLTGGIGSGKSTVAGLLAGFGAVVIDADAISRAVTACGGLAIAPIMAEFGAELIQPDGAMDRDKMRALVYADGSARQRLEAIIHPLVGQETSRQAMAAVQVGCRCIVFDVPLLVESVHWRQKLDHVLVIDCTPEQQIDRATARSSLGRAAIEAIMATQAHREQRLRAADSVIFNGAITLGKLADEVRHFALRFGLSSL
jgi:dephospho-CoA kinase